MQKGDGYPMAITEKSSVLNKSTSNEPYKITENIRNIILQLIQTCKRCNLGNVGFYYFPTLSNPQGVRFYIAEFNSFWELVISHDKQRDIYNINNDMVLKFQYSECD